MGSISAGCERVGKNATAQVDVVKGFQVGVPVDGEYLVVKKTNGNSVDFRIVDSLSYQHFSV